MIVTARKAPMGERGLMLHPRTSELQSLRALWAVIAYRRGDIRVTGATRESLKSKPLSREIYLAQALFSESEAAARRGLLKPLYGLSKARKECYWTLTDSRVCDLGGTSTSLDKSVFFRAERYFASNFWGILKRSSFGEYRKRYFRRNREFLI